MAEPVTLEELKQHLDVARTDQDALITGYGIAAREWVENHTGQVLVQRSVTQAFDQFGCLTLYAWPIASITSVEYLDSAGTSQPFTDYRLVTGARPARLVPGVGFAWPSSAWGIGSVTVTMLAGYADPADVPQSLKQAILLLVGDFYIQREAGVIGVSYTVRDAVESLCRPYRLITV